MGGRCVVWESHSREIGTA